MRALSRACILPAFCRNETAFKLSGYNKYTLIQVWYSLRGEVKYIYECQLESEPRARLILSHLCSFESDPPKHRSSNDPDGRSSHSYQEYMI